MKKLRLDSNMYKKDAISLAPELLGKILCRNVDGKIIKVRISETEAYYGAQDTACHAHKGKTARTEVMFFEGGFLYIYLCYGMHYLMNIVSGEKDSPEAVLIRGARPLDNSLKTSDLNGPAKLTKKLSIDKNFNKEDLRTSSRIWLEDDGFKADFSCAKRVGIDYATEEYREKLWRFILKQGEK